MARLVSDAAFHVAPELVGAPLASPVRRFLALVLDMAILALPTLAVTFGAANLWLRLADRSTYDALRTFSSPSSTPEALERAAPDLTRLLVRIDAPGLPAAVVTAVKEGRLDDASKIVLKLEHVFALTSGHGEVKPEAGQVVVPTRG